MSDLELSVSLIPKQGMCNRELTVKKIYIELDFIIIALFLQKFVTSIIVKPFHNPKPK